MEETTLVQNSIDQKEKYVNENIFVFYLYVFTICSGIIYIIPSISFYILLLIVFLLLIASIMYNKLKIKNFNYIFPIIAFMLSIFAFDIIFRNNSYIYDYLYNFIIFGVIPIYLYGQTSSNNIILEKFCKLSLIVFILYFLDPFYGYNIFNDYMSFGFNFSLPTFCGIYIGAKYFRFRGFNIISLISFIELIIFSNKGTLISAVFFVVLYNIFVEKMTFKHITKLFVILSILIILVLNIVDIITYIISILDMYDISSYSLRTIRTMLLENDLKYVMSNREIIWESAIQFFKNNIIIGGGTGSYQNMFVTYPHNLFIDILVQYGIVGFIIFLMCLVRGIYNYMFNNKKGERLIVVLLISLGIIPLLTSMIFYKSMFFWIYIYVCIKKNRGYEDESIISKL